MLKKISAFWLRHIHPRLNTLISTVGIVGLTTCIVIIFFVGKLAQETLEKESFAFDTSFLLWLHGFASPYLDWLMLNITKVGDPEIVVFVAVASLGILWQQKLRDEARFLAMGCGGALILNIALKLFFSKPRPSLWPQLITETSFSFPSGHALGSMVLYGFIAYELAWHHPKYTTTIYTLATLLIAAIGLSRLYLGVHWPTDIIAGYGVGFLWLTICITMLKLIQLKRI